MSHLHMPAAATTPQIDYYAARRRLVIDGECFPEDPLAFFEPIFATLRRHLGANPTEPIEALVRLRYVNSASAKAFRNLMLMLDEYGKGGASVTVFWARRLGAAMDASVAATVPPKNISPPARSCLYSRRKDARSWG